MLILSCKFYNNFHEHSWNKFDHTHKPTNIFCILHFLSINVEFRSLCACVLVCRNIWRWALMLVGCWRLSFFHRCMQLYGFLNCCCCYCCCCIDYIGYIFLNLFDTCNHMVVHDLCMYTFVFVNGVKPQGVGVLIFDPYLIIWAILHGKTIFCYNGDVSWSRQVHCYLPD